MAFATQHRLPLQKAMLKAFPDQDSLQELCFALGVNFEEITSKYENLRVQTIKVIAWAEDDRRERELLECALLLNAGSGELAAVVEDILADLKAAAAAIAAAAPWYEEPNPIETCFVRGGWAFMGRLELRQALQRLTTAGGPRSLVVTGGRRTGRSYTLQLIQHVALCRRYEVIDIELSKLGPGLEPLDLMTQVALQMRLDGTHLPERRDATVARWNMDLRSWLYSQVEPPAGVADGDAPVWWLVVDGIDQFRPSEATLDLIWRLIDLAEHRARHLRVVLLAYGGAVPPEIDHLVVREEIAPVDRGVLESFFELFFTHKGIVDAGSAVDAAVDESLRLCAGLKSLAKAPADEDLKYLSQAVAVVAKRLGGAPEGV